MEVGGHNNNNETSVDDPKIHWERCEESQRKRMKLMEEEKEKLQKEIDTMNSVVAVAAAANISDDDIIEINAGGKIISVLRSTLCLVAHDTMFSHMFSGRWEKSLKRDQNGRIFLDEDSQLIEIIINYLRMKKKENPSKPIQPPKINEEKKENFALLLDYFGLTDFFYPPVVFLPLDITNIDVVQPNGVSIKASYGVSIKVTKSENKIHLSRIGMSTDFYFVACKPPLDYSGEGSFWKVTIDAVSNKGDGLYLGIIGNLNASSSSYEDSTSCGWTSDRKVYGENLVFTNGKIVPGHGGWSSEGFTQGECLYFHLKSNKLTMFSDKKNQKFTIDVATTDAYYIHFNFCYCGTKITLEPLNEEERSYLL